MGNDMGGACADNGVEAMESKHGCVTAVQFHPEVAYASYLRDNTGKSETAILSTFFKPMAAAAEMHKKKRAVLAEVKASVKAVAPSC